jgi:hypothetical protein
VSLERNKDASYASTASKLTLGAFHAACVAAVMECPSLILYAHEDIGGIGENKLVDTINVNRVLLIMQSIRWKGEMFDIIMGVFEIEKYYANINTHPLEQSYTGYVDEGNSWIHQIKKWMKKKNIITINIKDMKHTHTKTE